MTTGNSRTGHNRLGSARSPYLRQHSHNPVHWWEWGDAAFAAANATGKPVLLSVGYAACHWCHVMAHESFENESIAAVMNDLFVNIKVDREERPDIDHIYMAALHALGEQGGWPLTMFLDSNRKPFWGGTYFPPVSRYGRPGFSDLLRQVAAIYRDDAIRINHNTQALTAHLLATQNTANRGTDTADLTAHDFIHAAQQIPAAFDAVNGGLSGAPKFPNPPILNALWRAASSSGDATLRQPVLTTLRRMALGGIHDHIGGGFARYSVDAHWLVPHFEKMLYDNAQLLELYALAAAQTGDVLFHDAASGIVQWLERDMIKAGGFASSLDADSEGEEGKVYVWSRSDIESILGPEQARLFCRHYDISNGGNFEGHNIPNRLADQTQSEAERVTLKALSAALLAVRNTRVPPGRDDKVLADWNGLMITALARAGLLLGRQDWVGLARRAHDFIRRTMMRDGALAHSWLDGIGVLPAFALDHAAMALASLTLAEATQDQPLLVLARHDLDGLHGDYADMQTGNLAMTHAGGEALIVRPAPTHDDAVPNANGVYAEALVRYAALTGDDSYRARADHLFRHLAPVMRKSAMAHGSLWSAFDLRLNAAQIVIAGPDQDALRATALRLPFHQRIVLAIAEGAVLPPDHPASGAAAAARGQAAAFVCHDGRCSLPIVSADALTERFGLGRD
ncbi:MAG: thioredoxin domain-containing protein [Beijerinckiaceae bacterium]